MVALSAIRVDLEQPAAPSAAATSTSPPSSAPPRRTRSTRKLLPPALLLLSILGLALAWGFGGDGPPRQRHGRGLRSGRRLGGADGVSPCDANHSTCALATQNCGLGSDGSALQLFDYFQFHYCTLGSVEPLSYTLLFLWLMVVFSLLASTADNYFVVLLETLSEELRTWIGCGGRGKGRGAEGEEGLGERGRERKR